MQSHELYEEKMRGLKDADILSIYAGKDILRWSKMNGVTLVHKSLGLGKIVKIDNNKDTIYISILFDNNLSEPAKIFTQQYFNSNFFSNVDFSPSIMKDEILAKLEEEQILLASEKQKKITIENQRPINDEKKLEYDSKAEFINFLKSNYNFDGFYHYTDFVNFIKIIQMGKLLSRNEAQKYGFRDAAEQSVIAKTQERVKDFVRFYYKEKTPTIYNNEGIKANNTSPHMPIPVLLVFNDEIIRHSEVAFTSGCGGSKNSQFTSDITTARRFDWETVFRREWIPVDEDSIMTLGYDINKANVINKRNAEFLYSKEIDIKHVKKIIFRSPADLKHAVSMFGKNSLFEINPLKFNNHRSYLYDYEFAYEQNCFKILLIFHSEFQNYFHKLKVTYADGFSEAIDMSKSNDRFINKTMPNGFENMGYFLDLLLPRNRTVIKMEYMMNGHRSARWGKQIND